MRGLLLFSVVALGVLALDVVTTPHGQSVAIVGDSITFVSIGDLRSVMGDDYDPSISAELGATVEDMAAAARKAAAGQPEQVIIELGSNNALHGGSIDEARASLQTMIARFGSARCIHLVNLNTLMTDVGRPVPSEARAINDQLELIAAADDRITIIDWNQIVADSVDAAHAAGAITDDTVHPNPVGRLALADAERHALDRCGRPWHIW